MPDWREICCICIQKYPDFKNINETDEKGVTYLDKLMQCVPGQVWHDEYHICTECIEKLNAAHDFVQICIKHEQFRTGEYKDRIEEENIVNGDSVERYECGVCGRTFKRQRFLKLHFTRVHKKIKKNIKLLKDIRVSDELDQLEFSSKIEFVEHGVEEADEKLVLKTENDKENIESVEKSEFDESSLSDIFDEKPRDSDYSDDDELEEKPKLTRKKTRRNKEPLTCKYCGLVMHKKQVYYAHIRSKHTFEKPFSCDECDARYMNAYSLLIHKRKHNNEKPFICASCGKSFISSADLNHHNKIHNAERGYPCPQCDRSFKTHSNLRTHRLQMHLDPSEWKFCCNMCEKKFPIRGNLVKHMKRHVGLKEFDCHICAKKFFNKAELNLHLNTHSNNRLYKCNICMHEYKNREGLRRHMKVVHDMGNWKAPKVEKKYMCPMCPKVFAFSNKLQRHICTHTGEKPFRCDFCPKRFIDNYCRKVHMKKEHNVEFYKY